MNALAQALPLFLGVVGIWWLSTGLLLYAVRRLSSDGLAMKGLAATLLVGGLLACLTSRGVATQGAIWLGFLGGLALWAFHEVAFLVGWTTGPRRMAASTPGLPRLREAIAAVSDRQMLVLATAGGLGLAAMDSANAMAFWTFLALWALRLATEINLFLGAPHGPSGLLPPRLAYLASYFRTDRISPAFPLTLNLTVAAFVLLADHGFGHPDAAVATTTAIIASLVLLGIAELFFLILPFDEARLWRWAKTQRKVRRSQSDRTRRSLEK